MMVVRAFKTHLTVLVTLRCIPCSNDLMGGLSQTKKGSCTLTTAFVKTPKTLCARAQNGVRGFPTTKVLGGDVGPKIFVRTSKAVFHIDVT
jgi:hypothetical protein